VAGLTVGVRARRAVAREHVRLHAHPEVGLVALTSQPASVHALLSESVHGVLTFGVHCRWSCRSRRCNSSVGGHVCSRGSGRTRLRRCSPPSCTRCRRCPGTARCRAQTCDSARTPRGWNWWGSARSPRSCQMLPSVSVHGVLTSACSSRWSCHSPVATDRRPDTSLVMLILGRTRPHRCSPPSCRRWCRCRAGRAVGRERVRLHAHAEVGIGRADLAARDRAHIAVRSPCTACWSSRALAAGRVAAAVTLIDGRQRSWSRGSGRTRPHRCSPPSCRRCCRCPGRACCRSRNVCVCTHTPRSALVGLDLAARERAHVAVRVRARRAQLRRALAGGRIAAPVALIGARTRLGDVVLVAAARAVAARRRAGVAVAVRQACWSVANVCVCTHTPLVGSVGLASQPAIVHTLLSMSVHGWLVFGVPHAGARVRVGGVVGAHPSVHSSPAQGTGHWGWPSTPGSRLQVVLHVASPLAKAAPARSRRPPSMTRGVPSALRTRGRLRVHHDEIELEVTENCSLRRRSRSGYWE